jgi:hypothetical protein
MRFLTTSFTNLCLTPAAIALLLLTASCADTSVTSRKFANETVQPRKLYVLEKMGVVLSHDSDSFTPRLAEDMKECGLTPQFGLITLPKAGLTLDNDHTATQAVLARMKAYQPDYIFVVTETGDRWGPTKFGDYSYSDVTQTKYLLQLFDEATHKAIWAAQIDFYPSQIGGDGSTLTNAVMARVKRDKLFQSCH